MLTDVSDFQNALQDFAESLRAKYQDHFGVHAWAEDQLKAPMERLVGAAAQSLGVNEVRALTEVRAEEIGRPDIGVTTSGLLTGHIELKQPGKGANPKKFSRRDREQWTKFKNLPNLVYSDGIEFAHYRSGERVGKLVRLTGDITVDGAEVLTKKDAERLIELFREFLRWRPVVPKRPRAMAELLAPVCRLLREDVETALEDEDSPLAYLAQDWRRVFFPSATAQEFADAYAQTLTYALLLARFSGAENLSTEDAVSAIRPGHHLLAETLRVLGDSRARAQVETPISILERIIQAVDPKIFDYQGEVFNREGERDPWLYFYEDFLAAYDPRLRKNRGVYFTPWQVVQAQVHLTAQLLDERFDAPDTFANEGVITLDPACGTGTYILAATRHALEQAARMRGEGARASVATRAAKGIHAFEILVGPYAVAHLRLTQQVKSNGGGLPEDGAHVYLTDTLESPHANPPSELPLALKELSEEHDRAQRMKREVPVLVCLGNPPYDRQVAEKGEVIARRKGGWVRYGDGDEEPPLNAFLAPLEDTSDGVHAKNLYNDYVYFWRWALWKVCEQSNDHGIVSFITASSYLRGPGFKGMRKVMREEFDEVWILDLGGDNLGARRSDNVFAIRTPVCIATGIRHPKNHPRRQKAGVAAHVRFARVEGSEVEKLDFLAGIHSFEDVDWIDCAAGWTAPFLPVQAERFVAWPAVTDLFPWQVSGMQFKRKWPIASDKDTLERRWKALLAADDRAIAFKETRDCKIEKTYPSLNDSEDRKPAISELPGNAPNPNPKRIGYRSFDRHWAFVDNRVGDYIRPTLQRAHSKRQVYLTGILTDVLGHGPAAIAAAKLPVMHHFCGRGGKDIIPLWRDSEGNDANLTEGVTDVIEKAFSQSIDITDIFAYAYGTLSAPAYVEKFWEALEIPGPRVPITKEPKLFKEVASVGRELLWLHTYGERFVPAGKRPGTHDLPQGQARLNRETPQDPDQYPDSWSYDEEERKLIIGEGENAGIVAHVPPEVMSFSISGFLPVKSWLDYRMKGGAGRTSSPLDDIRPRLWSFDDDLLDLIWVLEATLERYEKANTLLQLVIQGDTFSSDVFPKPTKDERKGASGRDNDMVAERAPLFGNDEI